MWVWMKWKVWVKILLTIFLVGFVAVPLAITLIAINPQKQFATANDTKRLSDANELVNAINQYYAVNHTFPPSITTEDKPISSAGADICKDLVPKVLPLLPADPKVSDSAGITNCQSYDTGYIIKLDGDQVMVSAPHAESGKPISIEHKPY